MCSIWGAFVLNYTDIFNATRFHMATGNWKPGKSWMHTRHSLMPNAFRAQKHCEAETVECNRKWNKKIQIILISGNCLWGARAATDAYEAYEDFLSFHFVVFESIFCSQSFGLNVPNAFYFAKRNSRFPKSPSLMNGNKQRNKVVSIQSGLINQSMIKKWKKKNEKVSGGFSDCNRCPGTQQRAQPNNKRMNEKKNNKRNENIFAWPTADDDGHSDTAKIKSNRWCDGMIFLLFSFLLHHIHTLGACNNVWGNRLEILI